MKIGLYYEWCHPKNLQSIRRMCQLHNDVLVETNTFDLDLLNSCDWVWIPDKYLPGITVPAMFGPHLFVTPPADHDIVGSLQTTQTFQFLNTLSPWVQALYKNTGLSFKTPLISIPFSVDTQRFCPNKTQKARKIDALVYYKNRETTEYRQLKYALQAHFHGKQIDFIEYGSYQEDEYLTKLQNTKVVVWLGVPESQGFALQEALSCNVPVLCWDATLFENTPATSIPYFDFSCGRVVFSLPALTATLQNMWRFPALFQPREFILRHLSDKACWQRLTSTLFSRTTHPPSRDKSS